MRPAALLEPDEADVGIYKVGDTEPICVEKVAGIYEGYESYSLDFLGRSNVVLAWHPTEDILLLVNQGRLRRFDCRGAEPPRVATLAEELGAVSNEHLAFAPDCHSALIGISSAGSLPGGGSSNALIALALAPLDGGPARKLPLPERFGGSRLVRQRSVSLWQPVANSATFLTRDGSQSLVRRLDLMTAEWTTVATQPGAIEYHGASRDGSLLVGTVESYDRPPDVYRFARDFTPQDRLTTIEPRLAGRRFGIAETFDTIVPLHDGRLKSVRTAVMLPPGAKKGDRLPAIVACYGGSDLSRFVRAYGGGVVSSIPTPVFTSRAFAVVMTDAPIGPIGRSGQPIEELRDAVLPQVYRAAELRYVDIERLAVAGQSYGGYCTAALVSSTNLFRAAVAVDGVYDLPGNYGRQRFGGNHVAMEWTETGQGRMGQPPWSDLRRYLDNSPYYRADRIHTPLLIIHGRNDQSCPVEGAEKMFSALRRLNRTVQLAVYEEQDHSISEWEQKPAADATERMLEFLRRHLNVE